MTLRAGFVALVATFSLVGACSSGTPSSDDGRGGDSCAAGLGTCGGACVDMQADVLNCGSCGMRCASGQTCAGGACTCLGGLRACGAACTDLAYDPLNCGACGNVCRDGTVCSQGECKSGCDAELTPCGASCVSTATAVLHCGRCDNACPAGLACANGACACPLPGEEVCGGQCVDVTTSVTNCGSCGNPCGAGQTCQNGACSGGGQGGTGGMGATGGSSGSAGSGMGGSGGSSGGPPPGLPGVVVGVDSAGTPGCVPLCREESHPDDPDPSDDWAYEGFSCVLPNSATATRNQACTTGEPLPPIDRNGLEGVVVDSEGDGTLDCVPLCAPGAMPSSTDPAAADWGWEYMESCVIRETNTASCNQTCTTGQPIPSSTLVQRPGVLRDEGCVALCECGASGDDPGWGWEYQTTCVVPGTEPATGLPACTTNDMAPLTPPPIPGTTVAPGFYTQNGRLYDAKGNEFVMRGVNNPHIWFDTGNRYRAYQALDTIASYGTNTIRVVWETTGGTPTLLARILRRIVELEMVPMVELHDVTGATSNADLARMAEYYTQPDVRQVLVDYRGYLLVNIANEWSGNDFQNAYRTAITTLRNAGIEHTLVIDANGYGQNASSLFDNAGALLGADPEQNLLFSVHMYSEYPTNASVDAVLDRAVSSSIPLIVGEFGPQLQGQNVAWQQIMTRCQANRQGYLAWSWSGNDAATANLNIVNDFSTSLTASWGRQVMVDHAASIQRTAAKASIFAP